MACCGPMAARVRTPLLWRALMWFDRFLVVTTARLEVTGTIPEHLRGRPFLIAANHIGVFDVMTVLAACHRIGVHPRFLATAGLFRAPVVGSILRACGHLRVDRGSDSAVVALDRVVAALGHGRPVVVYPEGRISLDPGLWPERGKTGVGRMALAAGVPVVPVSQWGAHEVIAWGARSSGPRVLRLQAASWFRAALRRPVLRVHFGTPVDLTELDPRDRDAPLRARDRVMVAITRGLVGLRADEPELPRFVDPTRPTTAVSPWRPRAGVVPAEPGPSVCEAAGSESGHPGGAG